MDPYDAIPPPIRSSSREALQLLEAIERVQLDDDDSDEAAPPPIARKRSPSRGSRTTSKGTDRPAIPPLRADPQVVPPLPTKSPLRDSPERRQSASRPAPNFSHPFKDQHRQVNAVPSRSPAKSPSYRSNPRLPPSLRRWSSLETIESVTTTSSVHDEPQRPSNESSSTYFLEDDSSSARHSAPSAPSLTHSSDASSVRSASTPTRPGRPNKHSASSLFQKMKLSKIHEPLLLPEHLEAEKAVSFDQSSFRTSSSSSVMTISSGRPSELGYPSSEAGRESQEKGEWKASSYDTSGLSEADLKKCKKKGINPALYAEMKAARKGKWTSPIGGNTFL